LIRLLRLKSGLDASQNGQPGARRALCGDAGLDPAPYAGHSLRAGFCTQAYLNGAPELAIMRQSRHKSLDTMRKYVRDREISS
jgi:integrase